MMNLMLHKTCIGLFILMSVVSSHAQDSGYVAQRIDNFRLQLPHSVRPKSRAASTYLYWQKAAQEIEICTDKERLVHDGHWFGFQIGSRVRQALRSLPSDNVDPVAVDSIQGTVKAFDDFHSLHKKLGLDAFKEFRSDQDGKGSDKDPTGLTEAGKSLDQTNGTFSDMKNVGLSTDNALEKSRQLLMKRYGFTLFPISIYPKGTTESLKHNFLMIPATPCVSLF